MVKEKWKNIEGFENYLVSNLGRVKSLYHDEDKILAPRKTYNGYYQVCLFKDGKRYNKRIHRLVAEAFLDKVSGKDYIDHINHNKEDNRVENLRWVNRLENRDNWSSKDNNRPARKVIQTDKNGTVIRYWESISLAHRELNIPINSISSCCRGLSRTAGGFKWAYAV